ncbi:hypothetical protein KUCAC02_004856, partial [Chaenocephalus aceratus]
RGQAPSSFSRLLALFGSSLLSLASVLRGHVGDTCVPVAARVGVVIMDAAHDSLDGQISKLKGGQERAANHHSQSTLRPPLPPPHNHHTLSHQSANSLNRNTLRGGRNPIHAPVPGPGDGPTTPESVQLQDSWVLNSNVPLETRHFLFKTSSGTTPLFSSSSPGYPLTSGTVYSPPPRLLPRNTFSRSAFKLKKPSKYCSWKCAAVSAIAAAALLAILLSYFIGK